MVHPIFWWKAETCTFQSYMLGTDSNRKLSCILIEAHFLENTMMIRQCLLVAYGLSWTAMQWININWSFRCECPLFQFSIGTCGRNLQGHCKLHKMEGQSPQTPDLYQPSTVWTSTMKMRRVLYVGYLFGILFKNEYTFATWNNGTWCEISVANKILEWLWWRVSFTFKSSQKVVDWFSQRSSVPGVPRSCNIGSLRLRPSRVGRCRGGVSRLVMRLLVAATVVVVIVVLSVTVIGIVPLQLKFRLVSTWYIDSYRLSFTLASNVWSFWLRYSSLLWSGFPRL